MSSYWTKVLDRRLSRRRALGATSAGVVGAAFLAACGSDDTPSVPATGPTGPATGPTGATGPAATGPTATGPTGPGNMVHTLVDESSDAVRGGVLMGSHPGVILTWDPMLTGINIRGARRGYSQLFRIEDGVAQNTDGEVRGDLAESWEVSPDNLTIIAHLDPGAGLPPIAPVNGRTMDAEDVVFSWNRLKDSGVLRGDIAREFNPGAPVDSITALDERTVEIRLAEPDATVFSILSTDRIGTMYIIPKEAADPSVFDVRHQAIGSGPFYVTEASEIGYRWVRNPNFRRAGLSQDLPYVDEIHEPVIPEVAQGVAQFRAGAILWYGVPADQIVLTKRDLPQLIMRHTIPQITGTERIFFGHNEESPFRDERVRQAYMMTMDRDLFISVAMNTDRFEREGLPVETFWESGLGAGSYSGWFMDPRDSAFGAASKFHEFNLDEARALIEAAGHRIPLRYDQVYATPGDRSFPATFYTRAEIFQGMVESSELFEANHVTIDYQLEWNTERVRWSKGQFNGASWGPDTASPDGATAAFFLFNSNGGYFQGGDNHMDELTVRARREFDADARMRIVHDILRYNGEKMFNNKIGTAGSFALNWPALRNYGVFLGGTNWMDLRPFIDRTRAPLA